MTLSDSYALSCYREIGIINHEHNVTLVQHDKTGTVYVKKILSVFNEEIYRYLQENPVRGIPQVVEVAEQDGLLIVIEEYVSGLTLRSILDDGNLFSEEEAVTITEQICEIVRELHIADPPILHRDIKPSNIIRMPDGSIRLLDLNAARRAVPDKTEDTELIGTVGYAAPEQFGFGSSTVQTDIYSIGVVLCELLTGALPKEKIPRGRLGKIVRKCTRIDPRNRYRSVDELLNVLASCHSYPAAAVRSRKGGPVLKRFMIPGFRTGNPVNMLVAVIIYISTVNFGLAYTAYGFPPGRALWAARVICLVFLLAILLFTGNYLDILTILKINRIRNPLLRLVVILAIDAILFVIMVFAMLLAAVALGVFHSTLLQGPL